jgi:hypothetical protein
MSDKKLPIVSTEEWNDVYWSYNLPLQMWQSDDGNYRVLNYMPRKEYCKHIESEVTKEELPQFCKNTAVILRNLADLFESLGRGEIDHVYYPDTLLADAIADKKEKEEEINNG